MMWSWWTKLEAQAARRDLFIALVWGTVGLGLLLAGLKPLWSKVVLLDLGITGFLGVLIAMTAVATLRSKRPVLALGLGTIIFGVDICLGGSPGVALIYFDLVYATVKYARSEQLQSLLRVATLVTAGLGIYFFAAKRLDSPYFGIAFQLVVVTIVSAAWGWNVRSERARTQAAMTASFEQQTSQLQQTIAYDLHDLVGNQIAVAGLHIEAAKLQLATQDFAGLSQSLDRAKNGTDLGHRELRNLITVLSAVEAFQRLRTMDLDSEVRGLSQLVPAGRELKWQDQLALNRTLSGQEPAQRRVVLRVLQELVSNAVKHGQGDIRAMIFPDVDYTDSPGTPNILVVTIENELAAATNATPGTGIGMRGAQILLKGVGGTLQVSTEQDHWLARVTLPASEQQLKAICLTPSKS